MSGFFRNTLPCSFFNKGFGVAPWSLSTNLMVPCNGFRRITSHIAHARQYPSLCSSEFSDHVPFVLHFAVNNKDSRDSYLLPWNQYYRQYEKVSILSWNIMMRGRYNQEKMRFNNAYGADETRDEYLSRVERVVKNIGECVRRHPEIAMIFLQEAPVKEHELALMENWLVKYLPETFQLNLSATEWGVLTSTNQQIFPTPKKRPTVYTGPFSDMNVRQSTIHLPGFKTELTNLHLPHDNPDDVLNLTVNNLMHTLMFNIVRHNERYGSFVYIGDWNLAASTIEMVVKQAIEDLFHHQIPIRCDVTLVESPNGHVKSDGSVIAVDSALVVSYKISHRDLDLVQDFLRPVFLGQDSISPLAHL